MPFAVGVDVLPARPRQQPFGHQLAHRGREPFAGLVAAVDRGPQLSSSRPQSSVTVSAVLLASLQDLMFCQVTARSPWSGTRACSSILQRLVSSTTSSLSVFGMDVDAAREAIGLQDKLARQRLVPVLRKVAAEGDAHADALTPWLGRAWKRNSGTWGDSDPLGRLKNGAESAFIAAKNWAQESDNAGYHRYTLKTSWEEVRKAVRDLQYHPLPSVKLRTATMMTAPTRVWVSLRPSRGEDTPRQPCKPCMTTSGNLPSS